MPQKIDSTAYGWDQTAINNNLLAELQAALPELIKRFGVRVELTERGRTNGYTVSCAGNSSGDIANWLDMRGAKVIGANEYNRSDDFTAVYFNLA